MLACSLSTWTGACVCVFLLYCAVGPHFQIRLDEVDECCDFRLSQTARPQTTWMKPGDVPLRFTFLEMSRATHRDSEEAAGWRHDRNRRPVLRKSVPNKRQ